MRHKIFTLDMRQNKVNFNFEQGSADTKHFIKS